MSVVVRICPVHQSVVINHSLYQPHKLVLGEIATFFFDVRQRGQDSVESVFRGEMVSAEGLYFSSYGLITYFFRSLGVGCEIAPLVREQSEQDFVVCAFFHFGRDVEVCPYFRRFFIIVPCYFGIGRECEGILLKVFCRLHRVGGLHRQHYGRPIVLSSQIGCIVCPAAFPCAAFRCVYGVFRVVESAGKDEYVAVNGRIAVERGYGYFAVSRFCEINERHGKTCCSFHRVGAVRPVYCHCPVGIIGDSCIVHMQSFQSYFHSRFYRHCLPNRRV